LFVHFPFLWGFRSSPPVLAPPEPSELLSPLVNPGYGDLLYFAHFFPPFFFLPPLLRPCLVRQFFPMTSLGVSFPPPQPTHLHYCYPLPPPPVGCFLTTPSPLPLDFHLPTPSPDGHIAPATLCRCFFNSIPLSPPSSTFRLITPVTCSSFFSSPGIPRSALFHPLFPFFPS